MKKIIYLLLVFAGLSLNAQVEHDSIISALIEKYDVRLDMKCEILIQTDVENMIVPDKVVELSFDDKGKPKFKGKGIGLLPKRGIINQYKELLANPFQAIFISKNKDNLIYKLVSLDPKSEWITADIEFNPNTLLIHKYSVSTKKHGVFDVSNNYKEHIYPSKSVVTFNIQKFKLPIKFIGRNDPSKPKNSEEKDVVGTITLHYTYVK